MIEIKNLSKSYVENKNAVDNVQEQIKAKSSSLLGGLDLGQFGL